MIKLISGEVVVRKYSFEEILKEYGVYQPTNGLDSEARLIVIRNVGLLPKVFIYRPNYFDMLDSNNYDGWKRISYKKVDDKITLG